MTTWNVSTFMSAFEKGTLGRKSQYSTYWVNKFEGCNILCNKSSGYRGSREGLKVVAVYMGPDLCLFNSDEFSGTAEFVPRFSMDMSKVDMESITESGLVDIELSAGNKNVKSILFQLGDTHYFIEPYWSEKRAFSYGEYSRAHADPALDLLGAYYTPAGNQKYQYGYNPSYRLFTGASLVKLPEKQPSVKAARLAVIPEIVKCNPNAKSFTFRHWWFTPQPDYTPDGLSDENKALLKNPPMPWEYGLTLDLVAPILSGDSPIEAHHQKMSAVLGAKMHEVRAYSVAKDKYEEALNSYRKTFVDQDDEGAFARSQIAVLPAGDCGGVVKDSDQLYFVRGALRDRREANGSGFRYGGVEKLAQLPNVAKMTDWHSMVRGVGYVE